jgi:hypothetical protein
MRKVFYIVVILLIHKAAFGGGHATLAWYECIGPIDQNGNCTPNWRTDGIALCPPVTVVKKLRLDYYWSGSYPTALCAFGDDYRFLITLQKNGNWVADHTYSFAGSQVPGQFFDIFDNITMTPGAYRIKVVFQRATVGCGWNGESETVYSNEIIISQLPNLPPITFTGPDKICNTTIANYAVNGLSTNATYTFTSTNTSFKLNGQNSWPVTVTGNNPPIQIQPTVPLSSATITVSATASGYCTSSQASLQVTSYIPTVILSATSKCRGNGRATTISNSNSSTILGTNPVYAWQVKSSTNPNWPTTTISGATGPSITPLVNTSVEVSYDYRAKVRDQYGCEGPYSNPITITWCPDNFGACCTDPYNPPGPIGGRPALTTSGENSGNNMTIQPNPSNGIFSVSLENKEEQIDHIQIFDASGHLVKTKSNKTTNNVTMIDGVQLNTGVYVIKTITKTGKVYQAKIVIKK